MTYYTNIVLLVINKLKTRAVYVSSSNYLCFWLYFVFITSVVLTNAIKGTTASFLIAYVALFIPIITQSILAREFYKSLFFLFLCYVVLCLLSQIAVLLADDLPSSRYLILVSPERDFFLRSSIFTQSLYIIPSFSLFIYTKCYYKDSYQNHLKRALIVFVTFGFYKVLFYALFHINGDFLSNRIFGNGILNPAQFQLFILSGYQINRFVSLTGEPSMYVFAVFPFFVYFLYQKKEIKFSMFIFISLILTFSGTFALGILLLIVFHFLFIERSIKRALLTVFLVSIFIFLIPDEYRNVIFNEILLDKVNQQSVSGIERSQNFLDQIYFYQELPLLNKLFGVGFGTIRSTDFFSTLLVNSGILGFALFTFLFAYPIFRLPTSENALRIALMITYVILMISVSEFSYPSLWFLLGLAYNSIYKIPIKQER